MCKDYITRHTELTPLELEALQAQFRKDPDANHKLTYCQETKSLTIAVAWDAPAIATKFCIRGMKNRYKPAWTETVIMPRVVA